MRTRSHATRQRYQREANKAQERVQDLKTLVNLLHATRRLAVATQQPQWIIDRLNEVELEK